jgi:4-amino-4-deoxy-L-arabinose transferase-like glycosyltransferase
MLRLTASAPTEIVLRPASLRMVALALDLALFSSLVVVGLVVRWPYLLSAPRFTDEIYEVLRGLQIAQGRLFPLTSVDSYIGALQNYTFALAFLIGGENPWSPRLISWLAGGMTVGLTFLLGQEIARSVGSRSDRWVGTLAALMLTVAGVHVIVNSHIAWSHSVTPFYTTLGFWLVLRSVRAGVASLMAPAGLALGCALQTHLLAGMFIPAVAGYALWKARWLLRSRWTYLGIGLFLLAYSSVIVYNIQNAGDTVRHAQYIRTRPNYLVDGPLPESDSMVVIRNVGRTVGMLGETLVSSIDGVDDWPGQIDPALIAFGLVAAAAGLIWCARCGQPLPLMAFLATALILPLANPGRYSTITDGRYVSPLLPLCYASIAALVLSATYRRTLRPIFIALLVAVFVIQPLGPTLRYGQRVSVEVPSNEAIARSVDLLGSLRQEDDIVLLDNRLNLGADTIQSPREARAAYDGFTYLLPFKGFRIVTTQISRSAVEERLRRRSRLFAIIPPGYRTELLVGRLTPVRSADAAAPMDPAAPSRPLYAIYMVERGDPAAEAASS